MTRRDEWGRSAVDVAPQAMQLAQSHFMLTTCEIGLPSVLLGLICEYAINNDEFIREVNAKCIGELTVFQPNSMGYFDTLS